MAFTPEQQARIDRAESIINAVTHQIIRELGVVVLPAFEVRNIKLPDHRTRMETEARFDYAVIADWQPPQTEPIEYPEQDEDNKPHEATINAVIDGIRGAIQRDNGR